MKYMIRCWEGSPLLGEIAICQSMVPPMRIGRRLIGKPTMCAIVSGCDRS